MSNEWVHIEEEKPPASKEVILAEKRDSEWKYYFGYRDDTWVGGDKYFFLGCEMNPSYWKPKPDSPH